MVIVLPKIKSSYSLNSPFRSTPNLISIIFLVQVNEIAWNKNSDLFFLTNGQGCVHILTYPEMELQHVLQAHPGNCICIEFDPTGQVNDKLNRVLP